MRRSRTLSLRVPQRATSAPNRISATTVNGNTQMAGSRIAAHLAFRCEGRTPSHALAIIVSTTMVAGIQSGVFDDVEELVFLGGSQVLDGKSS